MNPSAASPETAGLTIHRSSRAAFPHHITPQQRTMETDKTPRPSSRKTSKHYSIKRSHVHDGKLNETSLAIARRCRQDRRRQGQRSAESISISGSTGQHHAGPHEMKSTAKVRATSAPAADRRGRRHVHRQVRGQPAGFGEAHRPRRLRRPRLPSPETRSATSRLPGQRECRCATPTSSTVSIPCRP